MADSGERDPSQNKVGRLVERHDLEGLGEELEHRWTAPEDDRDSLRELAAFVNRSVLEAELRAAGRSPTDAELDGLYEAITDGDVDSGTRTRKRRALERHGIDVDRLRASFVTHQTVHTYLTEVRNASFQRGSATVDDERTTLARLRNRTSAVTESSLDRLVAADRIADREYETLVDVRVLCRDCGRATGIEELLDDGGCTCEAGDERGGGATESSTGERGDGAEGDADSP